jgi:hypothetical protein
MKIELLLEQGLRLSEVSREQLQLFLQLPLHADPADCPEAESRLHQAPLSDPQDEDDRGFNSDWRDQVLPDLQSEFNDQLDTVNEDLKAATQSAGEDDLPEFAFEIPFAHIDHWYGALNQARLVMNERYRFPEVENEETMSDYLNEGTIKPYLIDQFYTRIQSVLLDATAPPED